MANTLDNLISTLYDDEEDKDTQNELSPLTATLKSPSLEDIETSRKLAYGARQEPMILGNVWRLGKAGIQSAFSDETFQEASQRIEEERQEEIIEDFPEFEGLEEHEEDAAIFTGRMGSALADPATFLLPWTKVAKAGKLATVGVGAGVATTDIALREQALYGEISPVTVGLAAVLGGGSSYLGDVVARQFGRGTSQGIKLSSKDLKALEDATPDTLVKPYVKEAPMVQQEIANNGKVIKEANDLILLKESVDHVRKVIKGTRYIKKEKAASKLGKELEALKLKPAILPRAERKRTLTLDQIEKLRSSAARKTAKAKLYSLAEIREALSKKSQRVTKKQTKLDEKLEELRKPLEELEVLYRKAGVSNYDELKDVTKAARKSHSEAFPKLLKQIEPEVEAGIAPIEELSKKGNLSARLLRKLVYEGTRPLFGGLLGFGLGTAFGDDDDAVMMYTLTFAGAGLGYWQKRIQRSTVLPKAHKKIADQVIQKQLKLNLNAWLRINTAASTAARMSAWGRELDVASKLTFKQQGATLNGKAVLSIEERSMVSLQENSRRIYEEVLPFIDDEMALTVGRLQNQFITEGEVLSKFGRKEAEKIFLYRDNVQAFTDQIADSVDEVGIKWNRLDKDHVYGLTQMWDWDAIHKAPELFRAKLYKAIAKQNGLDPIEDLTRVEKLGDEFVASLAGVNKKSIFDTNNNVTIPLTKNFEKKRMLVDQDSRIIMQDFLINDPRLTLQQLIMNTSDSVEFARTFGAKGEYLRSIRRQVHEKYNKIDPKGLTTVRLKKKELQQLNDSMDGFFGLYQVDKKMGDTGQNIAAGLTTLANTTMLTRVAIPSLGDLIQPLQNSGVHATIKAYGKQFRKSKGKTFAQQGLGIKYLSQMEHELRALSFGVDPNNLWQRKLSNINRRFFQIVQLERITNYARGIAYDTGVYRAFAIAKKKKITGVLKKEAGDIGVDTNELKYLSKFKTAEDAYKDAKGKRILHIAGFKSTERDALIPTVGNRLLFAQSNNPAIRAVGQFLSWAQAKTTQTNALITRVEGGDVKQAIRILGALTIYGGVRELQVALSPSAYYDSEEYKEGQSLKKWIGEALVLSGNVPFQVDKIANAYAGPGSVSPLTSIVPVVSLMEKLAKLPTKAAKNIAADDYIGVASNVLDVTPFGREFKGYTSPILGIEDKPNREGLSPLERALRVKGGLIEGEEVPYAKEKPEERINPFTGEPYTALYYRGGAVRKQYGIGGKLKKLVHPNPKKNIGAEGLDKEFIDEFAKSFTDPSLERHTINPPTPKYLKELGPAHDYYEEQAKARQEARVPGIGQGDTSLAMEALSAVSLEQSLPYHGILSRRKNFKQGEKVNVEEGSDDKKELNVVKGALEEAEAILVKDITENPENYENKRNIVNRNPLNIVKGPDKWNNKLSDEESTDSTFEQFPTLFDGTRAGVLNVHAKFINPQPALGGERRATSISDMVDVLSPAVGDLKEFEKMELENPNNPVFKKYIADRMGVGINDQLNFEDPEIMKNFVKAKTGFEGGNYELDDALTTYAVQDAFKYRQEKGQYGQFNKVDLTNPPPPL